MHRLWLMAKTVDEVMNKELFTVRSDDRADEALRFILALDITGAAVVDDAARPVGHVSMRDLVQAGPEARISEVMRSPALSVATNTAIPDAAKLLLNEGVHRLVVVEADGTAAGMVSSLDIVAGLMGVPPRHPSPFPHYDRELSVSWTDDCVLEAERTEVAPDAPGVLVLVHGKAGVKERVVWVEACENARLRLDEMLSLPNAQDPLLTRALRLGQLRFRAAHVPSPAERKRIVELIQGRAMSALLPSERSLA